jgi:hypothetical protein
MTPIDPCFLAMPSRPPHLVPDAEEIIGPAALLYRRSAGRGDLRLELILHADGKLLPARGLPRALRRISARGIIEGRYGWPQSKYVRSFVDWTMYGRAFDYQYNRSDAFVLTRDFVAHGQHDHTGVPILPKIANSRYGVPLYGLDGQMTALPIYLRRPLLPPRSAHERLVRLGDFGPQLEAILDLIGLPPSASPELTWLPPENYDHC